MMIMITHRLMKKNYFYIFFRDFFYNDFIYFQYNNIYDTEQMSTILLGHRSSSDGLEVERERDD